MQVSVIIPNYNGKELLEKNLPQVIKVLAYAEIIVVDDGSTDGSAEFLKTNYPQITVVEKVTNSGFATSVNLGVKTATADIFLLLNTDLIPQEGFLEPLIKYFQDPKVFAVGCCDESIEGMKIVKRGCGIGMFARGFLLHSKGNNDKKMTLWASGGSSAFRKTIWKELGGMDEIYDPFYWEDIDLSYRAQKSGYQVLFEPKSIVVHKHETGSIKKQYTSANITRIAYCNQFIFVWKNITDLPYLFQHLLWLPVHLLRAIFRLDLDFLNGFLQALYKLPQILVKRKLATLKFKLTDKALLLRFKD